MNNSMSDPRGTMVRAGNIMRIDNALVEDVSASGPGSATGFVLVSYAVPRQNGMISIELIRLNVGRNTAVINSLGQPVCLCDIRKGMWVDALFSPAMTRSIPPQSNAIMIVVRRQNDPSMSVTTDRVARVDVANGFLYTGSIGNINSQTRFVVTNNTVILGRDGSPIRLMAIRPGQIVRVTHANFQTASIPPQTTAFYIQVI